MAHGMQIAWEIAASMGPSDRKMLAERIAASVGCKLIPMNDTLALAIRNLRDHCNREINRINADGAEATPGFHRINELLKSCDKVFNATAAAMAETR